MTPLSIIVYCGLTLELITFNQQHMEICIGVICWNPSEGISHWVDFICLHSILVFVNELCSLLLGVPLSLSFSQKQTLGRGFECQ